MNCSICGHELIGSYCLNPTCCDFNPSPDDLELLREFEEIERKDILLCDHTWWDPRVGTLKCTLYLGHKENHALEDL